MEENKFLTIYYEMAIWNAIYAIFHRTSRKICYNVIIFKQQFINKFKL